MIDFYYFACDTNTKKWIYAPKILGDKNIYKTCSKCNSKYIKPDVYTLDLLIEGNGKFPDILLCGEYPFLIVSKRVNEIWEKSLVSGYIPHEINVLRKGNKTYNEQETKYYNIQITGQALLDLDKMNVKIKKKCSECGQVEFSKETWEFGSAIIKQDSWNNNDIFTFKYFERLPLCTKKIIEIIYHNKLTNFRFQKGENAFNYLSEDINLGDFFNKN